MLELSKRKRMMIMEQISDKRDRLPSAERRKLAENQYKQFVQTMSNFNQPDSKSPKKNGNNKTVNFKELRESYGIPSPLNILNTPTVNDIPLPSSRNDTLAKQFYELESNPQTQEKIQSPVKQKPVNFYKPEVLKKQQNIPVNLQNLAEEHSSQRDSEPIIQDEQIKIPNNFINNSNSAKTESNNNSQAIFFTSHFKEYINKQSPQKDPAEQIKNASPKIDKSPAGSAVPEKEKEESLKWEGALKNNASGRSLAFSNESSLKYSLNESAIQDIVTKKLSNQLVIDSIGESNHFTKLKKMFLSYIYKQNIKDFIVFGKEIRLKKYLQDNSKRKCFDGLLFNKELIFELKKNEIKANNFFRDKSEHIIRRSFQFWKDQTFEKKLAIADFVNHRDRTLQDKAFRTFKMLLFDRRINNQVEMYYLSKLFTSFKNVIEKESKRSNQRAYKFYFKNLKRKMFNLLIEGMSNSKRERQVNELAHEHYYFSLARKYFDAWKQTSPREEKYIRISMSITNTLKQTADHRLLQTKTFDFREIK